MWVQGEDGIVSRAERGKPRGAERGGTPLAKAAPPVGTQLPPGTIVMDDLTDEEIQAFREYWKREVCGHEHQPIVLGLEEGRVVRFRERQGVHAVVWWGLVLVALYVLLVVLL